MRIDNKFPIGSHVKVVEIYIDENIYRKEDVEVGDRKQKLDSEHSKRSVNVNTEKDVEHNIEVMRRQGTLRMGEM